MPNDKTYSPSRTGTQKFRVRHTSVHASDNLEPDRWLHTTVSLTLATAQPNNPPRWAMASSFCKGETRKSVLRVIALDLLIESRCQKRTMSGGEETNELNKAFGKYLRSTVRYTSSYRCWQDELKTFYLLHKNLLWCWKVCFSPHPIDPNSCGNCTRSQSLINSCFNNL